MSRLELAIGLAALLASAAAWPYGDACQEQLPQSLSGVLVRAYPGYRTPLDTDNAPDDIQRNRDHGGMGCLGVATGDFTGDGKKDYVVGLTARKGREGLAVIALPRRGGWNLQKIRSGAEATRFLQFVEVVGAGRFDRPAAVTGALEPGERSSLVCAHSAVRVGSIGTSARVYCYQEGRWWFVAASE